MTRRAYCIVSASIFLLVALVHALRLLEHWPVQLGPLVVPPAVSWVGVVVGAALAAWGVRAARR